MSTRVVYGQSRSENGWPMVNSDECDSLEIPGSSVRIPLRSGVPSTILRAFASRFNQLIEPLDQSQCGGWTPTNSVPTSNHLAGTACDLNWRKHPFQVSGTFGNKIDALRNILIEFEGNVFYGGDWANPKDEMHFQMGYDSYEGSQKGEEFAQRLRDGYLGIYSPPDPNAFPLPLGYYYGPLEGPNESVSGEWPGEPAEWITGLKRWQKALGLKQTGKWNDGVTPKAATTLQLAKRWPPHPSFGYGGVYLGEWDAVIKEGWRLPAKWTPDSVQAPVTLVKWADVSQYQPVTLDGSYPHPVVAFRASVADRRDTKFAANIKAAREMVATGKLQKVIAYHFWVPGYDNVATFINTIQQTGGVFPELAFMIDVEDGGTKWNIQGDQSNGVNDFISRVGDYFGNPNAALGYINFFSNGALWQHIPHGMKLIVPAYGSEPYVPDGYTAFGHQYADNENTPPFGACDINQAHMSLADFIGAFAPPPVSPHPDPVPNPVPVPVPTPGPLAARPTDPRQPDDLNGHVLSARVEGLRTQALVAALCEQAGIDIKDIFDKVKDSL